MSGHRYHRAHDLAHANDTVAFAAAAVPPGARVLDVGAADGSVAAVLTAMACTVVGVEPDPVAAEQARAHCERVIVGDVTDVDAADLGGPFDAIVFLDVLEHMVDPASALVQVQSMLAPGGRIVVSVPNATHAGVRLSLIENRFEYQDTGLLDRTHLRFFDHDSFLDLLGDAGLRVVHEGAIWREPWQTELGGADSLARHPGLAEQFAADPHATTYQFLAIAVAASDEAAATPAPIEPALVFRERAADLERAVQRLTLQAGSAG